MKKIVFMLMLFVATTSFAQVKPKVLDLSVIKSKEWVMQRNDSLDYAFDTYKGQPAMILKREIMSYKSASLAYPGNLKFKNGIIELDLALPGNNFGFVGVAFRIKNSHHYETVYFRPYDSGTVHAIQYMPAKTDEFNWWDYEGEEYQASALLPKHNWFHVKLVIIDAEVKVYINYATKPSMTYTTLDPSLESGSVGFWMGNCRLGAYKNLKVSSFQ